MAKSGDESTTSTSDVTPGIPDGIGEEPVAVGGAGDHMVTLKLEGLPEKAVCVDYYGAKPPRLVIGGIDNVIEEPTIIREEGTLVIELEGLDVE